MNTTSNNSLQIIEDIFKIIKDNFLTKNKMTRKRFEKFKQDFIQKATFDMTNNDFAFEFLSSLTNLPKSFERSHTSFIDMIEKMTHDKFVDICNSTLNLNKMGCFIISPLTSEK